jgi:surfeit locus 1 family protein
MTARARGRLFFLLTLLLAAGFARLGLWQLSRLSERRRLNARAAAARAAPVVRLDLGNGGGDLANRRVEVTGRYDHAAELVLRNQSEQGVPGVRIVTPLRPFVGDSAVLVLRGYVTSPDARFVNLAGLHEPGVHTVRGLALPLADSGVEGQPLEVQGQLTWRRVDLRSLRRRLPYPVRGVLLVQNPDSSLPRLPRRDDPPTLDDGGHLSYAIQWFGFAITAMVVGWIVGFRRR